MREFSTPVSECADEWYRKGYWHHDTFVDIADRIVEEFPEQEMIGPQETATFREVQRESRRVAAGLQELGVEPEDTVAYQLPNRILTVTLHLAISRLGAVANPIVPIYRGEEVEHILRDGKTTCIFVPDSYRGFEHREMVDRLDANLPELEHKIVVDPTDTVASEMGEWRTYSALKQRDPESFIPPSISPDDVHALLYTSGTTADPKGVLHSHNTLLTAERSNALSMGLSHETRIFIATPVTHLSGLTNGLELPFLTGGELVLMDQWDPADAVDVIREHDCKYTIGATPFLKGILDESGGGDLPLRVFSCGGAGVPPDLVHEAMATLNCTVFRVYGCTEYPGITRPTLDSPVSKCAETDGPLSPSTKVHFGDPSVRDSAESNLEGEIWVRGPRLMLGYNGESINEEAFTNGWFRTGDIGELDDDGFITITGRTKDVIIRGGENIPIKDVEDRLYEHPAVADVAIVAMPDPEMQEKGCAYVAVEEDLTFSFDEMIRYLEDQGIAKQKFPERLEHVQSFPKTASGKIQKQRLREDIAEKLDSDPVKR